MLDYLRHVLFEIDENFIRRGKIFRVQPFLVNIQEFSQFADKVYGHFGKVDDKVERILDLVGDSCGQATQGSEFLLDNELVLRLMQLTQSSFKFLALFLFLFIDTSKLRAGSHQVFSHIVKSPRQVAQFVAGRECNAAVEIAASDQCRSQLQLAQATGKVTRNQVRDHDGYHRGDSEDQNRNSVGETSHLVEIC